MQPASAPAAKSETLSDLPPLEQFVRDPFEESIGYSLVLADAKTKIIERFGAPNKQESSTFPDRTSDAILTYFFLQYEDVAFHIIESEAGDQSWINKIEITGNTHALKYGLGVGSKRSFIISLFKPKEYFADKNPMRLSAIVSETRTDTKHRPGEPVSAAAEVTVFIEFDVRDVVRKIVLENIED